MGRVPRHLGKLLQPQKALPEPPPCFATRRTMASPHFGHRISEEVASTTGVACCICRVSLIIPVKCGPSMITMFFPFANACDSTRGHHKAARCFFGRHDAEELSHNAHPYLAGLPLFTLHEEGLSVARHLLIHSAIGLLAADLGHCISLPPERLPNLHLELGPRHRIQWVWCGLRCDAGEQLSPFPSRQDRQCRTDEASDRNEVLQKSRERLVERLPSVSPLAAMSLDGAVSMPAT